MAAAKVTIGYISMAPDDWQKTKLIVNWGANVENSGVNQGAPRAILNALENGHEDASTSARCSIPWARRPTSGCP